MPAAPYGSWRSPLSAAMAAEAGIRHSEPWLGDDGSAWWLERRPKDGGRTTLVHDGQDVTPPERQRPHPRARVRRRRLVPPRRHGLLLELRRPAPLPPRPRRRRRGRSRPSRREPGSVRYADGRVSPDGRLIVCVRETHGERRARRTSSSRCPPTARARRACSRRAATSTRSRASARTAPRSPGPAGTTRTCPGTAPSSGSRRSARSGRGAAGGRRPERVDLAAGVEPGRACSTSCPTAAAGGTSTARTPSSPTSRPSWATRSGASAGRATRSSTAATSPASGSRAATSGSASCARASPSPRTSACPTRPSATPSCGADGDRVIYAAKSPAEEGVVVSWSAADGRARPVGGRRARARARVGARAARDRVPERRRAHRARLLVPAARTPTTRRRPASARRSSCRSTAGRPRHAIPELDSEIAVLDEPRDRRGGRELRRQHRLRARVPRAAERRLGDRGRGGLHRGRAPPRARGRGRRRAAGHARRQRGRLHHPLRAGLPRRLRGRRELLRRGRRGDAGRRHAQVRVALPRLADRPLSRGRRALQGALADPLRGPASGRP